MTKLLIAYFPEIRKGEYQYDNDKYNLLKELTDLNPQRLKEIGADFTSIWETERGKLIGDYDKELVLEPLKTKYDDGFSVHAVFDRIKKGKKSVRILKIDADSYKEHLIRQERIHFQDYYKNCLDFLNYIEGQIQEILSKGSADQQTNGKPIITLDSSGTPKNSLTAPVIALFCWLVNEAKLIQKDENENVENFCKRVCKQFSLNYRDRIRQNFQGSYSGQNVQMVKDLILPNIRQDDKDLIINHLNSKNTTEQKLYA